jgi:Fe2+ transport system protein FeoA
VKHAPGILRHSPWAIAARENHRKHVNTAVAQEVVYTTTHTKDESVLLNAVRVGQRAMVSAVKNCPKELLQKLISMGVVAGSEVTVTQRGFFGSPVNIHVFGSVLSLRKAEAAHIQVQPL